MCTNTLNSKFQGSRKPQTGLWMCYLAIICLSSLPCVLSSCNGLDTGVTIYPATMIHHRYGEPLEVLCVAEQGNTGDLTFYMVGEKLSSETLNSTTKRLFIKDLEKGKYSLYCKNNVTRKKCFKRVVVDEPPSDVTDFRCTSRNLEVLNCTWTSTWTVEESDDSLTFIINGHPMDPCVPEKNNKTKFCYWSTTTQPRYRQMEDYYNFQLESCNNFGCHVQNFVIDHFSVVKPDAPQHLTSINVDPHSVLLQWRIPNNMYDILPCPIIHRIEYQIIKTDNKTYFRSVNTSGLPPKNRTYIFLLSDLPYAHTMYEVRIYIKTGLATEDIFWSDYTYIRFETASEKPQRPPQTTAGAFKQMIEERTQPDWKGFDDFDDTNVTYKRVDDLFYSVIPEYDPKRTIVVSWKGLKDYEHAGSNFTYKLVAKQGSNYLKTWYVNESSSATLPNAPLEALDIFIWSVNDLGISANSSYIYIPSKIDSEALQVHSFTEYAYKNDTHLLLWIGSKNIDNYTLFWCESDIYYRVCLDNINFTVLSPNHNSHVIDLPKAGSYLFSITANNGSKTSGMISSACHRSDDVNIPLRDDFILSSKWVNSGKSFVVISWSLPCLLEFVTITGYLVTYCPASEISCNCDTCIANKYSYYVSDPAQMELNITDLKPDTSYRIKLAINTTHGFSKNVKTNRQIITTKAEKPKLRRNVTISDVQNNSLVISWKHMEENIVINKYVIINYEDIFLVKELVGEEFDKNKGRINLTGLQAFTNYSFHIQVCSPQVEICSDPSPPQGIFVRTRIGSPSKMKAPYFKYNPDTLYWHPPESPGGYIDRYEIKRIIGEGSSEIYNTTNLYLSLKYCNGLHSGESFQVRAVSLDNDAQYGILGNKQVVQIPERQDHEVLEHPGEWSDMSNINCVYDKSPPPDIAHRLKIDIHKLKPNKRYRLKLAFNTTNVNV